MALKTHSLFMRRVLEQHAAPRCGIGVGNCLRKSPDVPAEVFGGVLPFAIGMVSERAQNSDTVPDSGCVVFVDIAHTHQNGMDVFSLSRQLCRRPLSYDYRALLKQKLRPVISNAQPLLETKLFAKPRDGFPDVAIGEFGDEDAIRD